MFEDLTDRRGPFRALVAFGALALALLVALVASPQTFGLGSGDDQAANIDGGLDQSATRSSQPGNGELTSSLGYDSNLAMLRGASVRNSHHDGSPYRFTPSDQLVLEEHYGPRSDYLTEPGGNPEQSFPIAAGGQFRAGCEFSHFSYDDPLLFPGRPGASHLHMHFGNTDINAFTTFESLLDSGSSTCNGQELNRTGYWVPAMFDAEGNVRVPERVVVYYKGEGRARGEAQVYPDGAALIATENLNTLPTTDGGADDKLTFVCTDNFSTITDVGGQTIPVCDGARTESGLEPNDDQWAVLEMNVKFNQCWNGEDPADWTNFQPSPGGWYSSNCVAPFDKILPNLEYFVNYKVDADETTEGWFLSSDVDPTTFGVSKAPSGSTSHGDWWGAWNSEVADLWIDNCVNFVSETGAPSGCGFGYLTDGGPNGAAPVEGPALKIRPQFEGPFKVSAEKLFAELCPDPGREYTKPEDAAFCRPGVGL
ncbi:MAG: DUF1996 domain-containing protein [Acidimicrobiales bacterium]